MMQRIYKKVISLALGFFILGLVTSQCASKSDDDQTLLLLLLLYYIQRNPAPVQNYVDRSTTALTTWNIGLQTGVRSGERSTDTNYQMNPPNWMTVANESCSARGVPANWQGSSCSLTGGTIGICITRYYTGGNVGQLVDTTLVMLDSYQTSSASDGDKQSVFTHEVGHCLGLRHAESGGANTCSGSYANCIMFPSTAGADTPHTEELSAIDYAYGPIQDPDGTAHDNRYSQTGTTAIRHWSAPTFTISSVIGSAMQSADNYTTVPPGPELQGEIETRVHSYHADGREFVSRYDQNDQLMERYEISGH
ncbi:MAG: hypothetical protein KDK39_01100 [Leptospiraceae bacterium]|nr:hypothetical protein [Leptospiraceae bacterium]